MHSAQPRIQHEINFSHSSHFSFQFVVWVSLKLGPSFDFDITIAVGKNSMEARDKGSEEKKTIEKKNKNTHDKHEHQTKYEHPKKIYIYHFRFVLLFKLIVLMFFFVPFQCSLCFCVTNKSFVHFLPLGHLIYLIFPV